MNCPRCAIEIRAEWYEGIVQVQRCPNCAGVWASNAELRRIEQQHIKDHGTELRQPADGVEDAMERGFQMNEPAIQCPDCSSEMARQEYGLASGILVDVCPHQHGLWLDAGELGKIEVYFERARLETRADEGILSDVFTAISGWFGR